MVISSLLELSVVNARRGDDDGGAIMMFLVGEKAATAGIDDSTNKVDCNDFMMTTNAR